MEDKAIVELYWSRNQNAIKETAAKYGSYCKAIAFNILQSNEDAEECLNDTWLGAWNSMPENRPAFLAPYLGKLCRWASLTKLRDKNCLKRGGGIPDEQLDELSGCLDTGRGIEQELELKELSEEINSFLSRLPLSERRVFLARYWYMASIENIAVQFGYSSGKVKTMLHRTRKKLRSFLEEEGLC